MRLVATIRRFTYSYKLAVYDSRQMKVVKVFRVTPLLVCGMLLLGVVVVSGVTVAVVRYTPIKYVVLGYDMVTMGEHLRATSRALDSLLRVVEVQSKWINAVRTSLGDTTLASVPGVSATAPPQKEQLPSLVPVSSSQGSPFSFVVPFTGEITRGFSPSAGHFGIDIKAGKGQPVRAAASGLVVLADYTIDNGYTVVIAHEGGWLTVYKHCARLLCKPLEFVRQGEVIAAAGGTGYLAQGAHLHFELWHQALPVDPLAFLPAINI